MEKAWAERAGLGWIGKNGCLITERFGSWVLLATMVTDVELEPGAPHEERCGDCTRCLPACPTGALVSPGVLDARRCISYHSIESRAPTAGVPLHGWLFGCDACQDACPWNRRAETTRHDAFRARPEQTWLALDETARMRDADFHARFDGTPIARARPEGLRRNARALLSLPVLRARQSA
jgi:epoxyqueuosine reductase